MRAGVLGDVQRLILATDMSRHGGYVAALQALLCPDDPPPAGGGGGERAAGCAPGGGEDSEEERGRRMVVAELLIKCADTSNVFRPGPVACQWAVRARSGACVVWARARERAGEVYR